MRDISVPFADIFTLPDEVAKVMVLGVGGRGSPRESEREERESCQQCQNC